MSQSSAKPPLLRNEAPLTSVLRELVPGFASTPGALGRNLTGEPSSIVAHPPPRGVPAVGDEEEVSPQFDKGFQTPQRSLLASRRFCDGLIFRCKLPRPKQIWSRIN